MPGFIVLGPQDGAADPDRPREARGIPGPMPDDQRPLSASGAIASGGERYRVVAGPWIKLGARHEVVRGKGVAICSDVY